MIKIVKKDFIQKHHLVYSSDDHPLERELVVPVRRGVHHYLTRLSMFKQLTKHEIAAIEFFLLKHKIALAMLTTTPLGV